ncbi:MAG TPA: FixH family protein [Pyrinomonadaceae bacterium]|nr:FixH family protein [Pyrinomonadaceae bacterium]
MLRKLELLIALCVLFALVQGCRRESPSMSNLTVSYEVSPLPARVGDVTITIKIKDGSNEPVAGARIKLEGNMSHAGMAPVFAEAKEIGPGQYRTNMNLSMAGDWQVLVRLTLPDGREMDQQFEIKEVAPA